MLKLARRVSLVLFLLAAFVPALFADNLYRYYNSTSGDHFYTTDFNELGNGALGYTYEWVQCTIDHSSNASNIPFYRYYNSTTGTHFYTTDTSEVPAGFHFEKIQGWVYANNVTGTMAPLYRYYNTANGMYFYTTNYNELGAGGAGYVFQKVQCFVSNPAR